MLAARAIMEWNVPPGRGWRQARGRRNLGEQRVSGHRPGVALNKIIRLESPLRSFGCRLQSSSGRLEPMRQQRSRSTGGRSGSPGRRSPSTTVTATAAGGPAAGASAGFPPIARADARLLICGSLPGQTSLARQQYYALPHNAFWKIAGELFGFDPALDYPARAAALAACRIALWDVCAAAVRPGSLDAGIRRDTVVPNAFEPFLLAHPGIRRICFNGSAAFELFERRVWPSLPPSLQALPRIRLPSTSPAHAGMRYADKLVRWREAIHGDNRG